MPAAASWVLLAGVHHHRMDVFVLPTAELASEGSGDVAVKRFVVTSVRIVHASVQEQITQARVPLAAVHTVERAVGITLKQGVIALIGAAWMMVAGIPEKRPRIPIFLPTVLAVFAHGTPLCSIVNLL